MQIGGGGVREFHFLIDSMLVRWSNSSVFGQSVAMTTVQYFKRERQNHFHRN